MARETGVLMERASKQDIYGELMDCIYLAQKYSKPLVSVEGTKDGVTDLDILLFITQSWDSWVAVRQVVDYVCEVVDEQDLSIW